MFIGENLNRKQIAVLQAVADRTCGCQFAGIEGVKEEIRHEELSLAEVYQILDQLEKECLVEQKVIKGKKYVGLTHDGKRCNLIDVAGL